MKDWEEICNYINKYAKKENEKQYQESIIDLLIKGGLGWRSEDIAEQPSYNIGSTQRIIPDIVISKEKEILFLIEVKKPSHKRQNTDIAQLESYMKFFEVNIGLYIGSEIEVFYKKIGESSELTQVLKISFNQDDEKGETFIHLFNRKDFDVNTIEELFKRVLANEENKRIIENEKNKLLSSDGQIFLKDLLTKYYRNLNISDDNINHIIGDIKISVSKNKNAHDEHVFQNTYNVNSTPIVKNLPRKSYRDFNYIENNPNEENAGHSPILYKGNVGEFAYQIVSKIIQMNKDKNFGDLKAVFHNKKNFIENIQNITDERRWFMYRPHKSSDGIQFVISNQWGLNGTSRPKFEFLLEIALRNGVSVRNPWT